MPPFQNPDEYLHMLRAAQIADGGLVGQKIASDAGGFCDPVIGAAYNPTEYLHFHPELRASRAMWSPAIDWSGERVQTGFAATALYPPFFYFPAALGIISGRALNLSVVQTMQLARLVTGVTTVVIGAVSIACAAGAASWLFAILTLPMSLSLSAALTRTL
jgi:hypothetical protein